MVEVFTTAGGLVSHRHARLNVWGRLLLVERVRPIGYDYVHSLIDDHSRFAYSEILPDEKGTTCAAFCSLLPGTSPHMASATSSGS